MADEQEPKTEPEEKPEGKPEGDECELVKDGRGQKVSPRPSTVNDGRKPHRSGDAEEVSRAGTPTPRFTSKSKLHIKPREGVVSCLLGVCFKQPAGDSDKVMAELQRHDAANPITVRACYQ